MTLRAKHHVEYYLEPQNVFQETLLNVLPDSYKKAQEKMKQQTLEALLSIFNEKIQYNRDTSTSPEKGRMHSNLKT